MSAEPDPIPAESEGEATVVVPRREAPVDDATVVLAPDATVVLPRPQPGEDRTVRVGGAVRADAAPAGTATTGTPAPPVEEPEDARSASDLAAQFFKPPLDARRRAPESPFPLSVEAEPRPGVRQGLPVVYGARSQSAAAPAPDAGALEQWLGAPPPSVDVPSAAGRETLPSTARENRRFRWLALGGGAGVLVLVCGGLWVIAAIAFA